MKKLIATAATAAALVSALGAAAPAAAQAPASSMTGSLGWSRMDTGDANLDAVTGRLGWRGGWFGVEGELSGGIGSDTVRVGTTDVKVKLENQAAIYATGTVPMSPNFDLFARVGYGTTKVSGGGLSGSEESVNYGVGAQYFFDGANGVRGDYTRQDFRHDLGEADVWSLSYVRRF
jgi:hypothetical protein